MDIKKYQGVIPAFYACYDDAGSISPERTRALARHLLDKGVKGLYVGGSSGECIYHSVAERKVVLENVMAEVGGKLTIIAHVACNNTSDSQALAAHAESLGVDAIAAIPPIYFHLPDYAIAKYWNDISAAAPNTDFVIYNIPQLAGVALNGSLLKEMLKNPRVIGVKNSSMPVQDIQMWKDEGCIVFNGPDEQFLSGLAAGAIGGIGGTLKEMWANKAIKFYMIAYFFYIDGVNTIISVSTSYGTTLGLDTVGMILALLVTQVVAMPFSILFGKLAGKVGSINLLCGAVGIYFVITVVGFFMGFNIEQNPGSESALALSQGLFWCMAFLVGTVQGGIQALSRSYFGKLVPADRSNEYFGFFDIFGKYAAVMGTFLVSVFTQLTGNSSMGVLSIAALFVVGFALLWKMPQTKE